MIAAPPTPRQARPRRPVTTLRVGERVVVDLRGPAIDRINQYGGVIVAVDDTAVRLDAAWRRFGWSPDATEGEIALPWSRIDRVRIEAPR